MLLSALAATCLLSGCAGASADGPASSPGQLAPSARARGPVAPPPHALFSYQIGGAFPPEPGVQVVDRDWRARPAAGLYNICYVNAFQAQPQDRRWWLARHRDLLLFRRGQPIVDAAWGEQLLDTSTASKRRALSRILGGWIARCAQAGFRAIEPDNLDSWERSDHALTARDNLALAASLVARAHRLHLAIAQKNAAARSRASRADVPSSGGISRSR